MLRKVIAALLFLCIFCIGNLSNANAESNQIFEVPVTKHSNQWKVELGEVKYASKMARPKKGESDMYSLKITNIGKEVYNAEFETYRDEPNSKTKYGLSLEDEQKGVFGNGKNVSFANLPIHVKANEFEVVVSWHDKPVTLKDGTVDKGREYKETFTFTRN
ncbi:TPA: hypothetical protein QCX48_005496 [Bacillus mycoides]|uniref:hypothetical protein n=1 Tax=Bacillus TaxID=1386 RepID=UPI002E24B931|nr:hypothetical protein [Bacillus mycoides]MED0929824.1 hypothetical protein [Bacillus mycoides]HDR7590554.1 hypothetical protein [Bacillus mycoides]